MSETTEHIIETTTDETAPTPEEIKRTLSYIGSIKTAKKAAASAENGRLGGRPQKPLTDIPCTCGRGDAIEGHPTSCPRGLALRRRQKAKGGNA